MEYFRLFEDLPGRTGLSYGLGVGRWNEFGTPMIYACSASSLNFLELLSIKGHVVTKSKWKLALLTIQESVPELDIDFLPVDWKNRPYPRSTQEFGTMWAKGMISPALKIPSSRIPLKGYPKEHNLLINPLYRDLMNWVTIKEEWDVSFEVNG